MHSLVKAMTRNNRAMFLKLLECISFLAGQGLSFRGRHEDSVEFEGNLCQLLLLQAKDNTQLVSWLRRQNYIVPAVVYEIITICGNETVVSRDSHSRLVLIKC